MSNLYKKYNVPVPRYTSYPTVPEWSEQFLKNEKWSTKVKKAFERSGAKGISLYIHLPFCESLCTYCGCNKRITKNHGVEEPYIEKILHEWSMYNQVSEQIKLSEIHLGGGTPTFFSPANLENMISTIKKSVEISEAYEFAYEGHPNNTTPEHIELLYELGFKRVSLGIQDFSPKVQKAINRIQPFEKVREVTEKIRSTGYSSLNFDLIYGLPFQTIEVLEDTFEKVESLMPDRIAFYSYAHVPWKAKSQRGYDENDLPSNDYKRKLYEIGKERLINAGYVEIGMDHFALPGDSLLESKNQGMLNRNFMGYTTTQSDILIGLGVSSISDLGIAYGQNRKVVEEYSADIESGHFSVHKGIDLSDQDIRNRMIIKEIICNERIEFEKEIGEFLSPDQIKQLENLENDGLISLDESGLSVTAQGKPFIRNVCAVFDDYYQKDVQRRFSKSI